MKSLPLLSIIVPVAPNRFDRIRAILSRLTLNKRLFPDHTFEVIVVDGGSTDNTRTLCEQLSHYINIKYIYVPICQFINAGYPRNIGMRVCEGSVIGMIDVDHWPSESMVYGMLNPFINDECFRYIDIREGKDTEQTIENILKNNPEKLHNQYVKGQQNVLNRGYVIDSSKSALPLDKNSLPSQFIDDRAMGIQILDAFEQAKIPFGVNNTLWTWSALRSNVIALNFYDEIYCRNFSYSAEDDDWRVRLRAQITGEYNQGVQTNFFDGQNKNFCAIHLWHPAGWRNQESNKQNKEYYQRMSHPSVNKIRRNEKWDVGKLLDYSFAIINNKTLNVNEIEYYIKDNIPDMPNYAGIKENAWVDIDHYMKKLEIYWNEIKDNV